MPVNKGLLEAWRTYRVPNAADKEWGIRWKSEFSVRFLESMYDRDLEPHKKVAVRAIKEFVETIDKQFGTFTWSTELAARQAAGIANAALERYYQPLPEWAEKEARAAGWAPPVEELEWKVLARRAGWKPHEKQEVPK
jgi:hypothetical protein